MHPNQREFIRQDSARILFETGAVLFRPDEPFTFSSGIKSPIYCNNRRVMGYPALSDHIDTYFAQCARDLGQPYDTIVGVATAGIPWGRVLAKELHLPFAYVRDPKSHGTKQAVEGDLQPGQRALVIEDHISTGESSVAAVEKVRAAGGIVEQCLAITTYQWAEADGRFTDARCALSTLTDFSTLVRFAVERHYLSPDQERLVRDWQKNPAGWTHSGGAP
ncbi:MAG: orotate phosphoribosyltransferase [Candidatus Woesearchaeota archaeon]|nr:orotate phosphoribosyltransferase [Candidatus Woesearchaeota archaeon]